MDPVALFCIGIFLLAVFIAIVLIVGALQRRWADPRRTHRQWCQRCRSMTMHQGQVCNNCRPAESSQSVQTSHPSQPSPPAQSGPQRQPVSPTPPSLRDDLLATSRQLERWVQAGQIPQSDYLTLIGLARQELQRLRQGASIDRPVSSDMPAAQAVAAPPRLEASLETPGEIPRETTFGTPATAPAPAPSSAPVPVPSTGEQIVDAILLEEPVGSPAPPPPVVPPLARKPVHPLDLPPEPPMPAFT